MIMLLLITHPHIVTIVRAQNTNYDFFLWNPWALWPFIDSKGSTAFKAQKGGKDIIKIVK